LKEDEKFIDILVRKPEKKRPLERPWRRREDNIKMLAVRIQTESNGLKMVASS
jgi:hypothetical protein